MRGRGLGPEAQRGDEYVNVVISVPRPEELSEEQLAHWKALAELAEK
jgi:DnaJ-class molecular chaperone